MFGKITKFKMAKKILKLQDEIAKTELKCGDCGEVVQVIDIEQHFREKHFRDSF